MPIQHKSHYIDRQADHEAVDQNLPPCTLIAFARAYAAYYCTGTNNNGKDYRLHATCQNYKQARPRSIALLRDRKLDFLLDIICDSQKLTNFLEQLGHWSSGVS